MDPAPEAHEVQQNQNGILRSGNSLEASFILFVNSTQRSVTLYWIDYNGKPSQYSTLQPQEEIKVDTYRSHPWIFRDQTTRERMQVAHRYIFWPKSYLMRNPYNQTTMPCRKKIPIHFPLRSLRDNALWAVLIILKSNNIPPNLDREQFDNCISSKIDSLSIPHSIKRDLKFIYIHN